MNHNHHPVSSTAPLSYVGPSRLVVIDVEALKTGLRDVLAEVPARSIGKLRLVAREDFLAVVAKARPVRISEPKAGNKPPTQQT